MPFLYLALGAVAMLIGGVALMAWLYRGFHQPKN